MAAQEEVQHVHPVQQDLTSQVQHVHPTEQDLAAEEVQRVPPMQPVLVSEDLAAAQVQRVQPMQKLRLAADALSRRKTKLPATIYQLRICGQDDEEVEIANDLEVRTR